MPEMHSFGPHGELMDEQGREVFDATKLSAYADCEELGKLQYEEHLTPKENSTALAFGIGFHKAVEIWTQHAAEPNTVELAEAAFLIVWERELSQEQRETLEFSGDRRSVANFKRLFAGYRKKFPLEMYQQVLAVEQPFTLPLGTTPQGREVWWSGVVDRIVRWQDAIYYVDVKTSSWALDAAFFNKFKLSGQIRGYTWAGQQLLGTDFAGAFIQGVQVQAPLKTKVRAADELVQAEVVPLEPEAIEEWKENTLARIDRIHEARERGHLRNFASRCSAFGGGCEMKQVCWAQPSARQAIKEMHYKERVWNPLDK